MATAGVETGARAGEGTLRRALVAAAATDSPAGRRLRYANTSVCFRADRQSAAGVTLLLDREPYEVVETDHPAEVTITLGSDNVAAFAAGRLPMTEAVITGAVETRGPVRRYLEVDAILRGQLAEQGGSGHDARPATGRPPAGRLDPDLLAIETRALHKSFGAGHILRGLDLQIPEGVISVVLGPSGTGKSVLLQHVIGVMEPDEGDVLIRGRSLRGLARREMLELRRGVGVMFQDGALFSAMNVFENVAFPLRQHTDVTEAEIREIVGDHLQSVGLAHAATRMPNELSGGMRKRAGLARALALNPGIVLCDEPDSGLDPVRTALLGDLLVEQHRQYGGTMVVVTHNVMLARRIADHMSVLWRGVVLESGMADAILGSDSEFVRQFLAGQADGPLGMDQ